MPQAFNKVLRQSSGTSYLVDSGGTRHHIASGGVYNCLTAWRGYAVLDNLTQAQVDTFTNGPPAACTVPEVYGSIVRQGSNGASWLVDGTGVRHPIQSGGVYLCFTRWKGVAVWDGLSSQQVDTFADGPAAACSIPEAHNTLLRVSATGASYYVDGAGTKHPIQSGGVYLCFRNWKGLALYDNLAQEDVDAFATGGPAACSVPEAYNTLLRVGATGASYYVDGAGTKHPIQSGGVYLCFRHWKGLALYDNLAQEDVDAFATGGPAACSVPEAYNTVIRETTTGTAYFLDGGGIRHHIREGATYNCLIKIYPLYHDLTWDHINTFAEGSPQPARTC